MAIKLEIKKQQKVESQHSGMDKTGKPFQFLIFKETPASEKAAKYARKIKCWVNNAPVNVEAGSIVELSRITVVTYGAEKGYGANEGRWFDAVSINADVLPCVGPQEVLTPDDFKAYVPDDGELPF